MTWKAFIRSNIPMGMLGHTLYIGREAPGPLSDQFSIVTGFTMKTVEPHSAASDDDFALKDEFGNYADVRGFLQAMSDAAWEIGIKPKQIEDNSNELKATKFHLEDMRQLAGVKGDPVRK